jgi:hypothetical protein
MLDGDSRVSIALDCDRLDVCGTSKTVARDTESCEKPGQPRRCHIPLFKLTPLPQPPAFFMKLSKLIGLVCLACGPGLAHAADLPEDLTAYAGKYPFNVVNGFSFFENPTVIAALDGAAGPGTADWVGNLDVGSPIVQQEDGIIAAVCEAHNCSNNNAALAITADGRLIALCLYSRSGDIGTIAGQLHWIGLDLDRHVDPPERGGGCPRDADEFLEAYGKAIQ